MNNAGYEIFYGSKLLTGEVNPFKWAEAVKVIKRCKDDSNVNYIFCVGPYGGGRRLIYRAIRGVPGWSAAARCRWKHLLDFPMIDAGGAERKSAAEGLRATLRAREQIESD